MISAAIPAPRQISEPSRRCSISTPQRGCCPSWMSRSSSTRASWRRYNEKTPRQRLRRNPPWNDARMKLVPPRSDIHAEPTQQREPATAMIEIDRVSQIFQTSGRQEHLALSEISLTIEDGAFVSILGPSGCGKSTLLYIVGGFVSPTKGIASIKGR